MAPPVELSTSASVTFWLISASTALGTAGSRWQGYKSDGILTFAQSKLFGEIERWKMEMMTYFGKLLALLLILFLQEISSFPLLSGASVQDIEKNLVVLEDIQHNRAV